MSKNHHRSNESQASANQNNQMSEDPGDGSRTSFTVGKDRSTPVEKAAPEDDQDQSTIEAFGEEGAGVAAKE